MPCTSSLWKPSDSMSSRARRCGCGCDGDAAGWPLALGLVLPGCAAAVEAAASAVGAAGSAPLLLLLLLPAWPRCSMTSSGGRLSSGSTPSTCMTRPRASLHGIWHAAACTVRPQYPGVDLAIASHTASLHVPTSRNMRVSRACTTSRLPRRRASLALRLVPAHACMCAG